MKLQWKLDEDGSFALRGGDLRLDLEILGVKAPQLVAGRTFVLGRLVALDDADQVGHVLALAGPTASTGRSSTAETWPSFAVAQAVPP
mgnify:CR=1 FL=1